MQSDDTQSSDALTPSSPENLIRIKKKVEILRRYIEEWENENDEEEWI
jgi:hypothetical protein